MYEYIQNIPTGLFIVLASLIAALVAVYIHRRNRFIAAANKFRNMILKELEGLFPVNGYWERNEYDRFKNSVPIVKREALEFRTVIPFYQKSEFDKAVIDYCAHSQDMNWRKAAADVFYDKETKITQKEKFANYVRCLLSFTE